MRMRPILLLCVFGLLMAACSSGASNAGGSSPTTPPSTSANTAADKALAQQAVLKLSDFPTGWTAQPPDNSSSGPNGLDAKLATCLHANLAFLESKSPTEA